MQISKDRRAGLLFGSFIADALALGPHWIYDTNELSQKFGYVDRYYSPGPESYHPRKNAGEQSHVGDQALRLAAFLSCSKRWHAGAFMNDWLAMWPNYTDYFDHATKTTLQNVKDGAERTKAASSSEELAGAARVAPLIAFMADQPETAVTRACLEQTLLTHASEKTEEAAVFLASATIRLLNEDPLDSAIEASAPAWALEKAESVLNLESVDAIAKLGQSCAIDAALPSVIYLALKYGEDFGKALSENVMAGGDTCARGLALGMLLGASHGMEALPKPWIKELTAAPILRALLA